MSTGARGRRTALTTGLCVLVVGLAIVVWYREEIRTSYLLGKNFEPLPNNKRGYAEYRHFLRHVTVLLSAAARFECARRLRRRRERRVQLEQIPRRSR